MYHHLRLAYYRYSIGHLKPAQSREEPFCKECDIAEHNLIAYELEKNMSDMEEDSLMDEAERNVDSIETWNKAYNQSEKFDFGDEVVSKHNLQEISMNDQELEAEEGSGERCLKAAFLKLHHTLGHLAFSKMKKMSKMGILAAKFANCDIPACTSCMYGKATRKPWRGKLSNHEKTVKINESILSPGDIICVDQMESKVPVFIAQMKGWLTKKRYKLATVFVD
jgi:hypothetical protein